MSEMRFLKARLLPGFLEVFVEFFDRTVELMGAATLCSVALLQAGQCDS